MLHSWRSEHPELSIVRVGIGPTADTEILRGADRDLLSLLFRSWVEHGQLPAQMSALNDVANTLVSLADHGLRESECGARDRAAVSAHQNHRRQVTRHGLTTRRMLPGNRVHRHRRR